MQISGAAFRNALYCALYQQSLSGEGVDYEISGRALQQEVLDAPSFSGVYAASLTPMHPDYSCDYEAFAAHCQDLIQRGCSGVLLFGTSGEGTLFSVQERKGAIRALIERGVSPHKVLVGIGCSAIKDAVDLAVTAVDYGCAGVLIAPPFFYKDVEDAGVVAFYREVILRIGRPELKVLLYHIPKYSGVSITLNIIRSLREEFPDQVIGLKESDGNLAFASDVISQFPGFKVFVGKEVQISEAVRKGAVGVISGLVNVYPELICSLYKYGKDHRKPDYNGDLKGIVEVLSEYPIFPAIKSLVEAKKGLSWHLLRPPLVPLEDRHSRALLDAIAKLSR